MQTHRESGGEALQTNGQHVYCCVQARGCSSPCHEDDRYVPREEFVVRHDWRAVLSNGDGTHGVVDAKVDEALCARDRVFALLDCRYVAHIASMNRTKYTPRRMSASRCPGGTLRKDAPNNALRDEKIAVSMDSSEKALSRAVKFRDISGGKDVDPC